jgi:heme/copper-type cytochrome/quinol oxidase subunit 3
MQLPKPPIKTMTDFIIFCFVSIVMIVILISGVTVAIIAIFYPNRDISAAIQILGNILTTLLGVVFGFIGGRAYSKVENKEKKSED